jgi:hypothetical protein
MRSNSIAFCSLVGTLVALAAPAPVAAQPDPFNIPPGPRHLDLSGSTGILLSTDWSDLVLLGSVSPISGALEQVLVRDLQVDPGPVFDVALTYWEGRYGFRARAGYGNSCLGVGRACSDFSLRTDGNTVDVDQYVYDIGGAIGLIDYRPGRLVWPYFFFGFGGVTYNLDRTVSPPLNLIERAPSAGTPPQVVVARQPDPLLIAIDELGIETQFAFHFGVGSDFRVPVGGGSLGVRLEVSDHLHGSPIDIDVADPITGVQTRLDFGTVHNLRAAAGIVVHFGR